MYFKINAYKIFLRFISKATWKLNGLDSLIYKYEIRSILFELHIVKLNGNSFQNDLPKENEIIDLIRKNGNRRSKLRIWIKKENVRKGNKGNKR